MSSRLIRSRGAAGRLLGWTSAAILGLSLLASVAWADDADPIEGFNRKMFWFNEKLDDYVLEPTARGWDYIAPAALQQSVSNFFANIRFPVVFVNNLLQGKPVPAATDLGRFLLNSTAGLAGFFDPAADLGWERHDEDFGQTLGVWGVPPGMFLMLPFLGPSSLRDGAGYIVDYPLAVYPIFLGFEYTVPARVIDTVNWRAGVLEAVKNAKEASVDYYVFMRDAYLQRRQVLIEDGVDAPEARDQELYYEDSDEE